MCYTFFPKYLGAQNLKIPNVSDIAGYTPNHVLFTLLEPLSQHLQYFNLQSFGVWKYLCLPEVCALLRDREYHLASLSVFSQRNCHSAVNMIVEQILKGNGSVFCQFLLQQGMTRFGLIVTALMEYCHPMYVCKWHCLQLQSSAFIVLNIKMSSLQSTASYCHLINCPIKLFYNARESAKYSRHQKSLLWVLVCRGTLILKLE